MFDSRDELDIRFSLTDGDLVKSHFTVTSSTLYTTSVSALTRDDKRPFEGSYLATVGSLIHQGIDSGLKDDRLIRECGRKVRTEVKVYSDSLVKDVGLFGTIDMVMERPGQRTLVLDHKTTSYWDKYLQLIRDPPASYVLQVNVYGLMLAQKALETKGEEDEPDFTFDDFDCGIHAIYTGPAPKSKHIDELASVLASTSGRIEFIGREDWPARVVVPVQKYPASMMKDFIRHRVVDKGAFNPFTPYVGGEEGLKRWKEYTELDTDGKKEEVSI